MTAHRPLVRGLVKIASSAPSVQPAVAPGVAMAPAYGSNMAPVRALNRALGQAAIPLTMAAGTMIEDEDTREAAMSALAGLAAVTALPSVINVATQAHRGELDPRKALADITQSILPLVAYGLAKGNI